MSKSKTMAVYVRDNLFNLEATFKTLENQKRVPLPMRPAHYEPGSDVALVTTGGEGSGGLYVFVGVLRGVRLSEDRETLTFDDVERFPVPIVGFSEQTGFRRDELMGEVEGWGPSDIYYVAPGAAKLAAELAAQSLRERLIGEAVCANGS